MHELWLCKNILEIIHQQASLQECVRVKKVTLEIGQLAAVEKTALEFCFSVLAQDTVAEHAVLEIMVIPGEAFCACCQKNVGLNQYYDACESCGNLSLTIIQGEELRVKSMEVE